MRLATALSVFLALSACQREPAPAPASAPAAQKSLHGAGLPFESGAMPKIEDLPVEDLGKFLGGTAWCRRGEAGELRRTFEVDGTWTQITTGGAPERGTWRVDRGRLVLEPTDAGTRTVDVQTGKVNGQPVVAFDGQLYGACDAAR